jgi:hypothetical protein
MGRVSRQVYAFFTLFINVSLVTLIIEKVLLKFKPFWEAHVAEPLMFSIAFYQFDRGIRYGWKRSFKVWCFGSC